jgi:hypothetical protein
MFSRSRNTAMVASEGLGVIGFESTSFERSAWHEAPV